MNSSRHTSRGDRVEQAKSLLAPNHRHASPRPLRYRGILVFLTQPYISAKEPCFFTKELCIAAKEPCISAKEPCISAKEPCISAKEPCISAKEPYLSDKGPKTCRKEPDTFAIAPSMCVCVCVRVCAYRHAYEWHATTDVRVPDPS